MTPVGICEVLVWPPPLSQTQHGAQRQHRTAKALRHTISGAVLATFLARAMRGMRRDALRQCRACGGTLLRSDYIDRPVHLMDRALAHHSARECSSERHTIESTSLLLDAFLDGLTRPSAGASLLPWPDEQPALSFCARHGLTALAQRLLSSGIDLQLDRTSLGGLTALHHAADSDEKLPLVEALLSAGANALAVSQDGTRRGDAGGRTAMHVAAMHGARLVALRLLDACSTAAATPDWDGCFPAQVAWYAGFAELALELADAAEAAQPLRHAAAASGALLLDEVEREEEVEQLEAMLQVRSPAPLPPCPRPSTPVHALPRPAADIVAALEAILRRTCAAARARAPRRTCSARCWTWGTSSASASGSRSRAGRGCRLRTSCVGCSRRPSASGCSARFATRRPLRGGSTRGTATPSPKGPSSRTDDVTG